MPDVDICENDDALRLWADMPGVSEKDVDVTLKDNMLTITGMVDASMYNQLARSTPNIMSATTTGSSHSTRRSTTHDQGPHAQWRARSRATQARAGKTA